MSLLGYSKSDFSQIFQDIIYIASIQLAFLGLELDSKYSIELSVCDQKSLDLFVYRFKSFIILTIIWTIFTCVYFLYRYGFNGFSIYFVVTLLISAYVVTTYHNTIKLLSLQNNLKLRYFNSKT